MKQAILDTLEFSTKIIISPDMDGFTSAQLLNRYNGSEVVGTYDKNILCLSDGVSVEECLFVDCDMNRQDLVSIGNHMRLKDDGMSDKSFNPNIFHDITKYSDKFPYATAFLISFATEIPTSQTDHIRMAFSDSTLLNMIKYGDNMRTWSKRMEHPAVSYITDNMACSFILDEGMRSEYPNQSFTSKRYGKTRYMDTLNKALEAEGMSFKPLTHGVKYLSDKVGLNTAIRYNRDIISYAEVYGGEYSVTYDQEIGWV